METEGRTVEENFNNYGYDIVETFKANRLPKTYQEAGNIAITIADLCFLGKYTTSLMAQEYDGFEDVEMTRVFAALNKIFSIEIALSGDLREWTDAQNLMEYQREEELKRTKKELVELRKNEGEGDDSQKLAKDSMGDVSSLPMGKIPSEWEEKFTEIQAYLEEVRAEGLMAMTLFSEKFIKYFKDFENWSKARPCATMPNNGDGAYDNS